MPVYNFDPSDDCEDWETELLDDQLVHTAPVDPIRAANSALLKLDTGLTRGLKVQNSSSSSLSPANTPIVKPHSSSLSPTATSGLLTSGRDSSSSRRMYTQSRDREPVV